MEPEAPPRAKVELAAGAAARAARFARAEAARRRTPREDVASTAARASGGSGEFAGRRRYRPGDDLRAFDWEAFARGAGSLVRLASRESAERWCVLLDTSASMAIGRPAKVQLAGELALALCALGLEWGGEVRLATARGVAVLRARADLARALAEIDGLDCTGSALPAAWFGQAALARCTRWILVGDLFDSEPASVAALAARRRRVDAFLVLAPEELAPSAAGARVEWRDPERGGRWTVELGPAQAAAYGAALSLHLERWRASLARARGELAVARAGDAFEPHLRRWIAAS